LVWRVFPQERPVPFTYPLHSLMARTGLRRMTTVGTTAELPVAGPATMSEKSSEDAYRSAITFSIHPAAVQADIAVTAAHSSCQK
jgi:hypothetical protein